MRGWRLVWVGLALPWVVIAMLAIWEGTLTADDAPALTDVQRLRIELQKTQEALLEAQYQLATCQAQQRAAALSGTRKVLEQDIPSGFVLDWATGTLKPVEKK